MPESEDTLARINRLAEEKLSLYLKASHGGLTDAERLRLQALERELIELWEVRRRELAGRHDVLVTWVERSYEKAA